MSTHFLESLPIRGREAALRVLPNFDFHDLRQVRRLVLETYTDDVDGTLWTDLLLTAIYIQAVTRKTFEVTVKFGEVRYVKLPELKPLFSLSEVEVEDVSEDQIEGVKYRTKNFGMIEFEVLSKCVEIVECKPA